MHRIKKTSDERGIVSLLVCMIMVVVITLIAVGFVQLSNNEQNSALNNQLSQEAYYAADSGINYATKVIQNTFPNLVSQSACTGPYSSSSSNVLSSNNAVSYPCVTVNTAPTSLGYHIPVGQSQVIPLNPTQGGASVAVSSIKFRWSENASSGTYSGCPSGGVLPTILPVNCDASVLQIDLVPTNSSDFSNSTAPGNDIIFLYPTSSAGASTDTLTTNNKIYYVPCTSSTDPDCSFTLNTPSSTSGYYMRVLPAYGSETGLSLSVNGGAPLSGAQAVIQSTGKAQDVVQSLEARVDISGLNPEAPSFAIQSQQSICAEQEVGGGGFGTQRDPSTTAPNCGNIEFN